MVKTHISRVVEMADACVQYDAYAKQLLSNKVILAWILKSSVEE